MSAPRPVSRSRLLRAVVLGGWAAFLAWLWISGAAFRYLGPRTYWVIPFGTIALLGAALVHLVSLRVPEPGHPDPGRPARADAWAAATLLVPIVLVAAVPGAELGASAADRRAPPGLAGALAVEAGLPQSGARQISFREIHFASQSDEYAATIGVGHGLDVSLTGFVSHPSGTPEGYFALTRFYVSCCAADAIPYSVRIPDGRMEKQFPDDTWLEVKGRLFRGDDGFELYPDSAEPVDTPANPYLY